MGRAGLLGHGWWCGSWPGSSFSGWSGLDCYSHRVAPPVLPEHVAGFIVTRPLTRFWWLSHRESPGLVDGLLALLVALAVALPWFILMVNSHGWRALTALGTPPDVVGPPVKLAATPDQAGAGDAATRSVRGRAGDPVGPGWRDPRRVRQSGARSGSFGWRLPRSRRQSGPADLAVRSTCSCLYRLACWQRRLLPTLPTAGYQFAL